MATGSRLTLGSSPLLEREPELAGLQRVVGVAAATDGAARGTVVLVSGEAGSGKSSLVRAWLDLERDRARILVGWCDDLATARAFAPLYDIAEHVGPLRHALDGGDPGPVLDTLLATLDDPLRPVVLLLEDVHWADDATLDAIRHVGRRIAEHGAILVLTYRDDELGTGHPLVPVLGTMGGAPTHRVRLPPLSDGAIARLAAERDVDVEHVARVTGGNAFLVTALLSDPGSELPASVRDVVMGCVARVGPDARQLLLTLAEVPGVVEMDLVDAVAADQDAIVEAEEIGLLVVDGDHARFRHEIARLAVRDASSRAQRRASHRRVLDVLLGRSGWGPGDDPAAAVDPVRVAYFAAGAGDVDVLTAIGPHAAHVAHVNGAHEIADRLQRAVLDHVYRLDGPTQSALGRERAWTLYSMGRHGEAHDAARHAVGTSRRGGDDTATVHALIAAARMGYMANEPSAAASAAREAIELATGLDDATLLAEATVAQATHAALVGDDDAAAWADLAIDRASSVERDDLHALALAYRAVASVHGSGSMSDAVAQLERAISLARRSGDDETIARVVINLLVTLSFANDPRQVDWFDVADAMDDGSRSWDGLRAHTDLLRAYDRLHRGDYGEAERLLDRMRSAGLAVGVLEVEWTLVRTRLAMRRGDEDAASWMMTARRQAADAAGEQFRAWLLALELERAWLGGEPVAEEVERTLSGLTHGLAWSAELATSARRAGVVVPSSLTAAARGPLLAGAHGDTAAAVRSLRRAELPYGLALALVDLGGEDELREAIAILDRLGAGPAAAIARERLAALGVSSVPRGPNRTTRDNPAGLTARQTEVLGLLVDGLTNAQIAERLTLSVRTVEDHVSAVLSKLDVATREEAAALGRDLLGA